MTQNSFLNNSVFYYLKKEVEVLEQEKKGFTIYLDSEIKDKIEDCFLECKIKNFQEGYREIISLGYEKFKQKRRKGK